MKVTDKERELAISSKEKRGLTSELKGFLGSLVELWGQMLEFENCGVFLWGEDGQGMIPMDWVHRCEDYLDKFKGEWIRQIADQLAVEKKISVVRDLSDHRKSLIFAPFKAGEKLGALVIWSGKSKESFTAKELEIFSFLAEQLNLYAESLHLQDKLSQLSSWLKNREKYLEGIGKLAAVGELTAGVAHDINNPLQIILGKTQLLMMRLSRLSGNNKHIDALQVIEKNATRISTVIKELADFARGKGEEGGLSSDVNLKHALKLAHSLVKSRFEAQNVKLSLKIENNLPSIKGDVNQIEQLLLNLLLNAKDSVPEGGRLEIDVKRDGDFVKLKFKDSRPPIPPEEVSQIFEPFACVGKSKGLGLGLYICSQIVTKHKGEIKVTSNPDEGTVFSIRLPVI
ncbi:MAG TPA: ATP-binding protein [candidate division Zixibacteria bacterium]